MSLLIKAKYDRATEKQLFQVHTKFGLMAL